MDLSPTLSPPIAIRCSPAILAGVLFFFLFSSPGISQESSQANSWIPLPIYGADVRSLAIDPSNPESIFAGTSGGHVYWSGDGGKQWGNAGEAIPFEGWVVASLVFDPNRKGRLWAGLWGIWGSGLVAVSDDGGKNWTLRREGLPKAAIYALALVPGTPGKLFAATRVGVYGTENEGKAWHLLSADQPGLVNVSSLLVDPFEPSTVFAGTWRRAYRSDDGGQTWKGIFEGMALDSEVFTLHAVPNQPGEIWASTCGWVYHSRNRGQSWSRRNNGLTERRSPSFLVMPDKTLLTGTVRGLYRSQNQGERWSLSSTPEIAVNTLVSHPDRPDRVWVGTEGAGVWISEDRGENWAPFPMGMSNLRVDAVAQLGNEVFAAVNHAGPFTGIYRIDGRGEVAREEHPLPTVLDLATQGDRLFAATEKGLFERQLGHWRHVKEVGLGRVEQLSISETRLVARTTDQLFEQTEGPFRPLAFREGSPKSIATAGESLWVATATQLFEVAKGSRRPISIPSIPQTPSGFRLASAGEELWIAGGKTVWQRRHLEAPWERGPEASSRFLETGDLEFPILALGNEEESWLYHQPSASFLEVSLPAASWDIRQALIQKGQLLLATAGQGLLIKPIPRSQLTAIPKLDATTR